MGRFQRRDEELLPEIERMSGIKVTVYDRVQLFRWQNLRVENVSVSISSPYFSSHRFLSSSRPPFGRPAVLLSLQSFLQSLSF
jgi:hypothetical protein